ncbi:DUF4226 domain-containing protein [Mycolicibacterium peregrinum]|uniref:DUF4226 domain-containing protein n=1 Tax=Mycolicibacterium peregrinum TaxID=43304 RepID=UPI003AB03748
MAGVPGDSSAAISGHEDRLAARNNALAASDRELGDIITGAYEHALNSQTRLTQIAEEIERGATSHNEIAGDPATTMEFHRFLLAKQKEIARIVQEAVKDATNRRDRLNQLHYPDSSERNT